VRTVPARSALAVSAIGGAARAVHHPFDHRAVAGDLAVGQEGLQAGLGRVAVQVPASTRSLPLISTTPGGRWMLNTVPRAVLRSSARLLTLDGR
jgi:hypothetical protein